MMTEEKTDAFAESGSAFRKGVRFCMSKESLLS